MRQTLVVAVVLTLTGSAQSQVAAQQIGGGIGMEHQFDWMDRGRAEVSRDRSRGRHHGSNSDAKRHGRSSSAVTPSKPAEVVKKDLSE